MTSMHYATDQNWRDAADTNTVRGRFLILPMSARVSARQHNKRNFTQREIMTTKRRLVTIAIGYKQWINQNASRMVRFVIAACVIYDFFIGSEQRPDLMNSGCCPLGAMGHW